MNDEPRTMSDAHEVGIAAYSPAWTVRNPFGVASDSLQAWAWDLGYRMKESVFKAGGKR